MQDKKKEQKSLFYLRGVKSSYLLDVVPSQRRVITRFHIKHKMFENNLAYCYSNWFKQIDNTDCFHMPICILVCKLEISTTNALIELSADDFSIGLCYAFAIKY